MIRTRFAPSPTGLLHIGGARTALFNWLYARKNGGLIFLRIEDTDKKRSSQAAIDAIINGIEWLGIDWDGEPVFQSERANRHIEVANHLLSIDKAYKCYASPDKAAQRLSSEWRDHAPIDTDQPYVVRLKTENTGKTIIHDEVLGDISWNNNDIDDYVLLRSDGTPTYMLASVVDDYDMGITHVIRGADHLNNAFRQIPIMAAMGWDVPIYAHIPLINGPDGKKMSKRHGAVSVESYRDEGILSSAMINYLINLGWSSSDSKEIMTLGEAAGLFSFEGVGKSPSRFDAKKLASVNSNYIKQENTSSLMKVLLPEIEKKYGEISDENVLHIESIMDSLKERSKYITDMVGYVSFIFEDDPPVEPKASTILNKSQDILKVLLDTLNKSQWPSLENDIHNISAEMNIGFGKVAQPIRAALTGSTVSIGIFDMLTVLGKEESLRRIENSIR